MSVASILRYSRQNPCPVCRGYPAMASRTVSRCWGFLASNGRLAFCTQAEFAGGCPFNDGASAYVHSLVDACACGQHHSHDSSVMVTLLARVTKTTPETARLNPETLDAVY